MTPSPIRRCQQRRLHRLPDITAVGQLHRQQNNKPTRTPLRCGTAEINTSAAAELCQVLPKYIPEGKIISRAEATGYLYGILDREATAGTSPKTLAFYSDTENIAYRKEIDSLTEDGIFSGMRK